MKKLLSLSNSRYRVRRLYRLGHRLRFLAADCICALATAGVFTRQPCSPRAPERKEIEPRRNSKGAGGDLCDFGRSVSEGLLSPKLLLLAAALPMFSCRTQYVVMPSSHTRDSTHLSVYTQADTIREYVHDSMSIRFAKGVVPAAQRYTVPSGRYTSEVSSAGGNGIPDTVYIDRWHTAYRDRWHFRDRTDTITVTLRDSIPYPVEVPIEVEKPIPRFYVNCTVGFWFIIIGFVLYIATRLYFYR